jgi:osmotically-inducible protein OsmY
MRHQDHARAWVLGAALALGTCAPAAAQTQGEPALDDQAIADAVEDRYLLSRHVDLNRIDVRVSDGIVGLTGTVSDLLAKERATRLAEMVEGVRAVSNRLVVQPTTVRGDAELRQRVEAALRENPATESWEIRTTVIDGVVTLEGTVESWTEKQLAGRVAKGVGGVVGLNNRLGVVYPVHRSDEEIRQDVAERLRWDARVQDGLIEVEVDEGQVRLSGIVGSAAEKRQAGWDSWVAGVEGVDDSGLEVKWWVGDSDLRHDPTPPKTDAEIAAALGRALGYDPRVPAAGVTPGADGGWVTLRGVVSDLAAKRAAERLARHTTGVVGVTNRIKVRPPDIPSDAELVRDIEGALQKNPYTEAYEIRVEARDGDVSLSGAVETQFEKAEAERVAASVAGVTRVANWLRVRYTDVEWEPYYDYGAPTLDTLRPARSDTEVQEAIESQLRWSPFVDAEQVEVEVSGGVATLSGEVDSWRERRVAQENAYEGGALSVVNDLRVP